eukprot:879531-Rhodomonas_salina.2
MQPGSGMIDVSTRHPAAKAKHERRTCAEGVRAWEDARRGGRGVADAAARERGEEERGGRRLFGLRLHEVQDRATLAEVSTGGGGRRGEVERERSEDWTVSEAHGKDRERLKHCFTVLECLPVSVSARLERPTRGRCFHGHRESDRESETETLGAKGTEPKTETEGVQEVSGRKQMIEKESGRQREEDREGGESEGDVGGEFGNPPFGIWRETLPLIVTKAAILVDVTFSSNCNRQSGVRLVQKAESALLLLVLIDFLKYGAALPSTLSQYDNCTILLELPSNSESALLLLKSQGSGVSLRTLSREVLELGRQKLTAEQVSEQRKRMPWNPLHTYAMDGKSNEIKVAPCLLTSLSFNVRFIFRVGEAQGERESAKRHRLSCRKRITELTGREMRAKLSGRPRKIKQDRQRRTKTDKDRQRQTATERQLDKEGGCDSVAPMPTKYRREQRRGRMLSNETGRLLMFIADIRAVSSSPHPRVTQEEVMSKGTLVREKTELVNSLLLFLVLLSTSFSS